MLKFIPTIPATQSEVATREMAIYRQSRNVSPIFGKLRAAEMAKFRAFDSRPV